MMLMAGPRSVEELGRGSAPAPPWTVEVSIVVAVATSVAVAVFAWVLGAGAHPVIGGVLFALAAAGVAGVSSWQGVVAAVLLMWAADDGFVIHRFGVLSLDPASVSALVGVCGAAGVVYGIAVVLPGGRLRGSVRGSVVPPAAGEPVVEVGRARAGNVRRDRRVPQG